MAVGFHFTYTYETVPNNVHSIVLNNAFRCSPLFLQMPKTKKKNTPPTRKRPTRTKVVPARLRDEEGTSQHSDEGATQHSDEGATQSVRVPPEPASAHTIEHVPTVHADHLRADIMSAVGGQMRQLGDELRASMASMLQEALGAGKKDNITPTVDTVTGPVAAEIMPAVPSSTAGTIQSILPPSVQMANTFKTMGNTVTDKIKGQILAHEYVDFARLLTPDSEETFQLRLCQKEGGKEVDIVPQTKSSVLNINQWDAAFAIYMAVYLQQYPTEVADLIHYGQQIKQMAAKNGNWRGYDERFRKFRAVHKQSWGVTLLDEWVFAATSHSQTASTPYQSKPNSIQNNKKASGQKSKYKSGLCFKFNDGKLCTPHCRFDHSCDNCGGNHPKASCRKQKQATQSFRTSQPTHHHYSW